MWRQRLVPQRLSGRKGGPQAAPKAEASGAARSDSAGSSKTIRCGKGKGIGRQKEQTEIRDEEEHHDQNINAKNYGEKINHCQISARECVSLLALSLVANT